MQHHPLAGGRIVLAGWTAIALLAMPANAATFQVCADGSGDYLTIQEAIDVATNGDEVVVCDGTFTGAGNRDLDFCGRTITVRALNGPNNCIIDCAGTYAEHHRGFYFYSGETVDAVVDGFTIRNGHAGAGGAVFCEAGSNPTILNCIISGNAVEDYGTGGTGGGISCWGSSPTIVSCVIQGNSATTGGGIYAYEGDIIVRGCVIADNYADYGGGVYCSYYLPSLDGCRISGNVAGNNGGGLCCVNANAAVTNCLLSANTATTAAGGAIYCHRSSPVLVNCTIAANQATTGGAVRCYSNSSPTITSCIMWGDSPNELSVASGAPVVSWTDIQGGWAGTGNINFDPKFLAGYYLAQIAAGQTQDSPCVDTGSPAGALIDGTTRTDGVPDAGAVDMGYHYPGPAACLGDVDGDCDADLDDLSVLADCLTGPAAAPSAGCDSADLDGDDDVDLADFAAFQAYFGS